MFISRGNSRLWLFQNENNFHRWLLHWILLLKIQITQLHNIGKLYVEEAFSNLPQSGNLMCINAFIAIWRIPFSQRLVIGLLILLAGSDAYYRRIAGNESWDVIGSDNSFSHIRCQVIIQAHADHTQYGSICKFSNWTPIWTKIFTLKKMSLSFISAMLPPSASKKKRVIIRWLQASFGSSLA